jgi:hypothetical protein
LLSRQPLACEPEHRLKSLKRVSLDGRNCVCFFLIAKVASVSFWTQKLRLLTSGRKKCVCFFLIAKTASASFWTQKMRLLTSGRKNCVRLGGSSNSQIEVPASLSPNTGSTKRKEISVSFLYGSDDRASSVSAPSKTEVRRSRRSRPRQASFTPSLPPCLSASDDQVVPGSPINEQPLSTNDQRESHEPHRGPPDDVSDETIPDYVGTGRYPKTPYLGSFSVENIWLGSSNGIRTVQFARERDHVHSSEGKCECTVAGSGSPGFVTLLGHLSDVVQPETSVQEVRTLLSEMIRLMESQIDVMEMKLAQDRNDFAVSHVQGLPMLHMRVEIMSLKRRVDSRKKTLLGMEEWRNDYIC